MSFYTWFTILYHFFFKTLNSSQPWWNHVYKVLIDSRGVYGGGLVTIRLKEPQYCHDHTSVHKKYQSDVLLVVLAFPHFSNLTNQVSTQLTIFRCLLHMQCNNVGRSLKINVATKSRHSLVYMCVPMCADASTAYLVALDSWRCKRGAIVVVWHVEQGHQILDSQYGVQRGCGTKMGIKYAPEVKEREECCHMARSRDSSCV